MPAVAANSPIQVAARGEQNAVPRDGEARATALEVNVQRRLADLPRMLQWPVRLLCFRGALRIGELRLDLGDVIGVELDAHLTQRAATFLRGHRILGQLDADEAHARTVALKASRAGSMVRPGTVRRSAARRASDRAGAASHRGLRPSRSISDNRLAGSRLARETRRP